MESAVYERASGETRVLIEGGTTPRYASNGQRLTANGSDQDGYLLVDLEKGVWMSAARNDQAALTDEVIEEVVSRLPPEYYALRGNELTPWYGPKHVFRGTV